MTEALKESQPPRTLSHETLRAGTVAGLAMMPFGAVFRSFDLRINEYGRKTLELLVGDVSGPLHFGLNFIQHMVISWIAAVPLLLVLRRIPERRTGFAIGTLYGGVFYLAANSLALPLAFGDPTPWELGFSTVYPSLVVHLVYGFVVALMASPRPNSASRR